MNGTTDTRPPEEASDTLFEVRNLRKWYPVNRGGIRERLFGEDKFLKAVDDVSFDVRRGEILGLAGQSGCGKSTLGELLTRLQEATGGEIRFDGEDVTGFGRSEMKAFRRRCQIIFQDPYESLNARYPVSRTLREPLKIHGIGDPEERDARVSRALSDAGLTPPEAYEDKLPAELSGGERQRVCTARALVLEPDFIVADEPVSMLDVSVSTSILQLFERLQRERDLSMLYISHNLSTINHLADRTMIMYQGNVVELGDTDQVIHEPAHPYTEALIDAVPSPDPDESRAGSDLGGNVPDPVDLPEGCRFHPRCKYATEECKRDEPPLEEKDDGRAAACIHPVNE